MNTTCRMFPGRSIRGSVFFSSCLRKFYDTGSQIIDPDRPLQHVTSSAQSPVTAASGSTMQHHLAEVQQCVKNLSLCTMKEIDEEKASHSISDSQTVPSVYFPMTEMDTDFAWKCDHVVGTRWLRIHRLWKSNTSETLKAEVADKEPPVEEPSIEEHVILISLPALDNRIDDNVADPLAGAHHPFVLTIRDRSRKAFLEFAMDIVNNEIILDNVVPRMKQITENADTSEPLDHEKASRDFSEKFMRFQGPCLTESSSESEEAGFGSESCEMIKKKNQVSNRLQSYLSVRGLLSSYHLHNDGNSIVKREKWIQWLLQKIAYHEQCEYEKWLEDLKDFVS